jgi:hypothetical protein
VQPSGPSGADESVPAANPSASPIGTQSLDDALAGLDALGDRPLEEHISAYEALHDRLQAELGTIDGS